MVLSVVVILFEDKSKENFWHDMLKMNNENNRIMFKICLKLTSNCLSCELRTYFNPIQDVFFRSCLQIRVGGGFLAPLPKIRHTYPIMMKLGSYTLPKEDPKNV